MRREESPPPYDGLFRQQREETGKRVLLLCLWPKSWKQASAVFRIRIQGSSGSGYGIRIGSRGLKKDVESSNNDRDWDFWLNPDPGSVNTDPKHWASVNLNDSLLLHFLHLSPSLCCPWGKILVHSSWCQFCDSFESVGFSRFPP